MAGKKTAEFSLNVGISSILFIFVILCLVSFAILSLSSAMSDWKLTSRVADNTTAYYTACNQAEEMLEGLDKTLSEVYESGISRTGYFERVGKKQTFNIPIGEYQSLNVEVKITYPESAGEKFYEVTSWNVEASAEMEFDETLPVWK
ncbi:MAG: hypothetical protein K6E19_04675 [Lachnospiraceae bacterium]|nr:hypothetical protein [Lachnospiraceae bacterium]